MKLSLLKEKLRVCEFPPDCGSLYWECSSWWDCVSASLTHFNVAFFSFATCVGVAQLVFWPLSEEIVPCAAVDTVCLWDEVSSGSSYIAVLNHFLSLHFMFHFSPSLPFSKAYKLFSEVCKIPGFFVDVVCFYDYSGDLDNSTERNPLLS